MPTCTQCNEVKDDLEFYFNRGRRNSACKACKRAKQKAYAAVNRDKISEYRVTNRDSRNRSRRDWYLNLRRTAIVTYGGSCTCCGESEYAFLVFDHVDGGGMQERMARYGGVRGRSGGHRFLFWLRDNGYPPTIQLLCANCNMAKHFYPGGCPHHSQS